MEYFYIFKKPVVQHLNVTCRFSTGWNCGLHSDWTELVASGCVDEYFDNREHRHVARRYFITTFLREPVSRFISEFHHVRRGATWLASRHLCNGRSPTAEELPPCFERSQHGWKDNVGRSASCPLLQSVSDGQGPS
ncbi:Heparan-sulfate 6-O-sulfotransferase 1-B [Trichinella spiralis]|uniref:Heparan-sulfate 6-O-sulfotransferase n=1 Tax=Trichinella spiralis TaxID=6334 RepID=A0ABR3KE86_TRISP